ncbi:type I-E CRISPR-associated endoribonuclease Cas2e [Dermatophilus congolensis]|uniref:type I-E CRISPR-associated endoribonuclease Cas2e n=1 Tax=Dermatophilus congolensis TaxID=1863 RepID=UPI001AAFBE83|nr:type I-E CRISPR-associated endoribonuclease Cas2 [Dermatophilus congolensis]MBO3151447.1 type I-E CRISPR-associated endoribonuclease Cas2 [Dermatophilus congolensis]MBO3161549.1 type I-E CRISPR-associated endoribonuclease Cas2 [Dermatophilus congolensis]MBO3162733.1 type I-E CRISPR-associated endoribonuclease Cas2 [Dermatophilus congolensis]MBO3176287.1 type I-E CRISPR-associated endoribonuclease Cas2 [Dermatophilus congolensis]
MVVLVLTACPTGLRGYLTRWLLEISPGVFVGHVNSRIRETMWLEVVEHAKDGRALLVYSVKGEQHIEFKVHRHDWNPIDYDGIQLMRRPTEPTQLGSGLRHGWSKASRYRRAQTRKPKLEP